MPADVPSASVYFYNKKNISGVIETTVTTKTPVTSVLVKALGTVISFSSDIGLKTSIKCFQDLYFSSF